MHKTLKPIISILTILIFLMPTMLRVWIVVDFKIQQDFIAKVLCINKDVPQSTCNGKCHLKKQLKQTEEDKHNKTSTTLKENSLSSFHLPTGDFLCTQPQGEENKDGFAFYPSFKKSFYINELLRPPQII